MVPGGIESDNWIGAMEEISDLLENAFDVSSTPNSTVACHPRYSSYKSTSKKGVSAQEVRRAAILKFQKQRRDDFLAVGRALVSGGIKDQDSDTEEDIDWMNCEEEQETKSQELVANGHSSRTSNVHRLIKSLRLRTSYRKQLMQSEWLVEIPADFETNWIAVPVPVGRRSLIVAGDGKTKHFSRGGAFINSFPSDLPGGSRTTWRPVTILDCIFSEESRTYWILDVMIWNDKPYYNHTTEVRWFFGQQHLEEFPKIKKIRKRNPYRFLPLINCSCSKESLEKTFASNSSFVFGPIELDGILFYHKEVHYLPGTTPLVGWLKGFMLPEILGITVSDEFTNQRPLDYGGMKTFVQEFNSKVASRKKPQSSPPPDEEVIVVD